MENLDPKLSSTHSILITDDNPQNLQVLGRMLIENRFKIEFAVNGESALEWLNKSHFDLVLLDINMPGMNGFEVCKKIRSNSTLDRLPVIFLSADNDRESILKGFEIGAQDYITKPFDSRELLVRVRTHIKLTETLDKLEKFNKILEEKVIERTWQLKEANKKLEELNLKLMDLDKAKTDFLRLISHEIRTPLNGIVGPLELLKESEDTREIGVLVNIMDGSVKRLEKFALDALLITMLKTKQLKPGNIRISLSKLIDDIIEEVRKNKADKEIDFKIYKERLPYFINGDPELIQKCFRYILENAIGFSPIHGTIQISLSTENQLISCEIINEGKGFVTGVESHFFEIFTIDDEYKDKNLSIDLPVAKMILDLHNGRINIGNNSTGGAKVKLLLKRDFATD